MYYDDLPSDLPVALSDRFHAARTTLDQVETEISTWLRAALTAEPKCPECKTGVLRPKCFFELGGDCPRQAVIELYGGGKALRERIKEIQS
jgi:hypothetical protein